MLLMFLAYLDKRKLQRFTKQDLHEYGKRYADQVVDQIKEKANIPSDITAEDYATYVKVHNSYVMAARIKEAERAHYTKNETDKLITQRVVKKVIN